MLHFIRERAQGWVAWFIVGLITIPFALWGVNSYLTGATETVVATVNGDPIKQAEFQRALQQHRDTLRQRLGDEFDPTLIDNAQTKRAILDGLIQQRLIYSANHTLGQQIKDSDISYAVQQTAAFQVDGQFNLERYKQLLSRSGFSPSTYEAQLRMDLMGRELMNNIQRSSIVTSGDVTNLLRIEKQKRELAYALLDAASLSAEIVVNDIEAMAFYEENQAGYKTPERVSVDYIDLSVADLIQNIEVNNTVLSQFYDDNQSQFMSPEQRQVSHILVEGDEDTALKILEAAKHRLSQGEAFDVVAAALSQDTGSASAGGDLGLIQRGVMGDDAFDDALFSLPTVGDVSDIVKTDYGYHLIKATDIRAPEGKAFDEVKKDVEASYRHQQAEQLFYEQAELLAELSYENPDSLELAADELALKIKSSALFTRSGGEGIAKQTKVVNIAFSNDVLVEGLNSAVIELADTRLIVLHKKQHELIRQLPFESVNEQIKNQLKSQHVQQEVAKQGKALLSKLEDGAVATTLFTEAQWHDMAIVERGELTVDREVLEQAYAMQKPEDQPIYHGFGLSNGSYAIVKLKSVIAGDVDSASEQDRAGLSAYIAQNNGTSELKAFLASLKADADIDISASFLQ